MGLIILQEDAVLLTIIVKTTKNIFDDNCSKNNKKESLTELHDSCTHSCSRWPIFSFFKKKLRQYEVQKAACDMFLYCDSTAQESGGLLLEVML